jgi:hypothetical protein
VPKAEFSERHYELAMNMELLRDSPLSFVPTQPEEKILGYDVALVPALPSIWDILQGARPPGAWETPDGSLPFAASLFLQYKRPEFLSRGSASQWSDRIERLGEHSVPYYRYELGPGQLKTLLDLSDQVGEKARVIYAAAQFHTAREFFAHRLAKTVVETSNFLPLPRLGKELVTRGVTDWSNLKEHFWTYARETGHDLLFSDPVRVQALSGADQLRGYLAERVRRDPEGLWEHLDSIADAVSGWSGVDDRDKLRSSEILMRLAGTLTDSMDFPEAPASMEIVVNAFHIYRSLEKSEVGWFLALENPGETTR